MEGDMEQSCLTHQATASCSSSPDLGTFVTFELPFTVSTSAGGCRVRRSDAAEASPLLEWLGGAEYIERNVIHAPPRRQHAPSKASKQRMREGLNGLSEQRRDSGGDANIVQALETSVSFSTLREFTRPLVSSTRRVSQVERNRVSLMERDDATHDTYAMEIPVVAGDVTHAMDLLVRVPGRLKRAAAVMGGGQNAAACSAAADRDVEILGLVTHAVAFRRPADPCFRLSAGDGTTVDSRSRGLATKTLRTRAVPCASLASPFRRCIPYRHLDVTVRRYGLALDDNIVLSSEVAEKAPSARPSDAAAWIEAYATTQLVEAFEEVLSKQPVMLASGLEVAVADAIRARKGHARLDLIHTAIKAFTYSIDRGPFNRCRIAYGYNPVDASHRLEAWRYQRILYRFPPGIQRILRFARSAHHARRDKTSMTGTSMTSAASAGVDGGRLSSSHFEDSIAAARALQRVDVSDPRCAWFREIALSARGSVQMQVMDTFTALPDSVKEALESAARDAANAGFCEKYGWLGERAYRLLFQSLTEQFAQFIRNDWLPHVVISNGNSAGEATTSSSAVIEHMLQSMTTALISNPVSHSLDLPAGASLSALPPPEQRGSEAAPASPPLPDDEDDDFNATSWSDEEEEEDIDDDDGPSDLESVGDMDEDMA